MNLTGWLLELGSFLLDKESFVKSFFFTSLGIEKPLVSQMTTNTWDQLFSIHHSKIPFESGLFLF